MKKTIFILAIVALLGSCGGNESKPAAKETNTTQAKPTAESSPDPEVEKGLDLIMKSDCLGCHKVEEKLQGPAYRDVAKRYAGKPGIEDTLAAKIINGGSGNWGQVPMVGHPNISEEDAKTMVKYVLSLKE